MRARQGKPVAFANAAATAPGRPPQETALPDPALPNLALPDAVLPDAALPRIVPLATVDPVAVEALLDRAFEPERRGRTAYKVRGSAAALPALSFAAIDAGALVGTVQCWPVSFVPDAGAPVPLVMVGPVAVDPDRQRGGLGRRLVERTLAAAAAERMDDGLVLIGDADYYGRFFGFGADRTAAWRLPGPVDRHRLLARGARVPEAAGTLGPSRAD